MKSCLTVQSDNFLPLFDAVQAGIIVIDSEYLIVLANQLSGTILGKDPDELVGSSACYNLFAGAESTCDDCPLENESVPWPKQRSVIYRKDDGSDLYLKVQYSRFEEYFVLSLQDVTREITLLRDVDLTKKEQQAKNVLLERRRQDAVNHSRSLENLLNQLPEAIVSVNDDFTVRQKNEAVAAMLVRDDVAKKCYELVGNREQCPNCPAGDGFKKAVGMKKSHMINGRYFTETIAQSSQGDGGVLTFHDITRQFELIGEIRDAQKSLAEKNDILSSLVNIGASMQKEFAPEAVVEFFLNVFMPIIGSETAIIMVNDIRPGTLWFTEHKNVSEKIVKQLGKAYRFFDINDFGPDRLIGEPLPWEDTTQLALVGGQGHKVGFFLLKGKFDQSKHELIQLFIEPLGAYIHNQLLMRQLEDKANTDPLTGLFNRGYFEAVLQQEQRKYNRYKIPYAVVVADVNRLKEVNDRYGHEEGDLLLKTVARLLSEESRETDITARIGGDEFFILLVNTDDEGAQSFIKRLSAQFFQGVSIEVASGVHFPVSVSLGAAGADKFSEEQIFKEADERMYEDKRIFYQTHERYR